MDGQIVYQVRVDSSNVSSDLNTAAGMINSGTQTLITLGQQAAAKIGNALSSFFAAEGNTMNSMLSTLSGGFNMLSGSTASAAASLSPLTQGISYLLSLDLNKLLSFFTQMGSASAGKGAAKAVSSGLNTVASAQQRIKSQTLSGVPTYRSGKDFIEKDKYAYLHKGEAVLTAAENQAYRSLGGIEGLSLLAEGGGKAAPAPAPQPQLKFPDPQPQNVNVTVELDGYQMAKVVATATNELNRQLNTRVVR